MLKQQKGMTLLALVFTIIVMLALAAVAIAMVLDELSYDPEPVQIYTEQQNTNNENSETPITETPETEMPTEQPTDNTTQGNEAEQPVEAN